MPPWVFTRGEDWKPWHGKELVDMYDEVTGRFYTAWKSRQSESIPAVQNAYNWRGKEKKIDTLTVDQKTIIFKCIYRFRVLGEDWRKVADYAIIKMRRNPGQLPLTERCVLSWDMIRQRKESKGEHWPFRDEEQFSKSGLPEIQWLTYLSINRSRGVPPTLGISWCKRPRQNWRAEIMATAYRHESTPLFQRDGSLWERPSVTGTIRQRVWWEVVEAARKYVHASAEAKEKLRHQLRGTAIGYGTFVDPYSMDDEALRSEVIKRVEKEAVKYVRTHD